MERKIEDGRLITGPWRATRLWNEIVRSFALGMPTKRHKLRKSGIGYRLSTQYVDASFTGSEAVEFLHKYLKVN